MEKNFDNWNSKKKQINDTNVNFNQFFYPKEVWWCSVGINIGIESDGKNNDFERPVLILKKFNRDQFWGIPLTSNEKNGIFYHKIKYNDGFSWVMLTQIRVFSTKRLLRNMFKVSNDEFSEIKIKLKNLI